MIGDLGVIIVATVATVVVIEADAGTVLLVVKLAVETGEMPEQVLQVVVVRAEIIMLVAVETGVARDN
jgi:hypothetical protein